MKFSNQIATSALALMGVFSSVAIAGSSYGQPSPEVERATHIRQDRSMATRPAMLARAMVSRPVELWNDNMKDVLCRTDPTTIMRRVGSEIQQERRDVVDQLKGALSGRFTDRSDITKNVSFTYADIVMQAHDRKIDYMQAKNMVDDAASAKMNAIRKAVSGLNCQ